ncbi:MAG TPA: hypothetical protein VFX61_17035 [Micromonosporaceae bacterium]|nr:hypothetical protein [Micromonosporaceae bacterium]
MTGIYRGVQHETDVLIRQVDRRLARLQSARGNHDLDLAELIAASLRQLIIETARASAADRARVRAAVRFFVLRREGHTPAVPARPLDIDLRVVNDVARQLGRADLVVESPVESRGPQQSGGRTYALGDEVTAGPAG